MAMRSHLPMGSHNGDGKPFADGTMAMGSHLLIGSHGGNGKARLAEQAATDCSFPPRDATIVSLLQWRHDFRCPEKHSFIHAPRVC